MYTTIQMWMTCQQCSKHTPKWKTKEGRRQPPIDFFSITVDSSIFPKCLCVFISHSILNPTQHQDTLFAIKVTKKCQWPFPRLTCDVRGSVKSKMVAINGKWVWKNYISSSKQKNNAFTTATSGCCGPWTRWDTCEYCMMYWEAGNKRWRS